MNIQPQIPHPDTIEPQSPPESPTPAAPREEPMREPPEVTPETPDIDQPGRGPDEAPPPANFEGVERGAADIGQGGVLQSNLDQRESGSVE